MKAKKCFLITTVCLLCIINIHAQSSTVSLQALLDGMSGNNDLLKYYNSMVQSKNAEARSAAYERLPHLNTMYQMTVGSDNNVQGSYLTMGVIPSLTGGTRAYSNMDPVSGNTALAGIDWEVVNFGGYKAHEDLAKSGAVVQNNLLIKTRYDLQGIAATYYLELVRQSELIAINRDNVARQQQLLSSISNLIVNGIRPGIDSSIASSELSKSQVSLYEAQKNYDQMQVELSSLSGLPVTVLQPDTNTANKLITTGAAFALGAAIDTAHHPEIGLYSSMYDYSRARLQMEKKKYYPKLMLDADVWTRGSGLSSTDVYSSNLGQGLIPERLNYFVGLTLTYDIMNIVRKHINSKVYKYESEASQHRLQQEKVNINNDLQKAQIETAYQLNRFNETNHQLRSAASAYQQQENLYRNGLSSLIDLNIALNYFIQARRDHLDAKIGYMRGILNYSLITNSFNPMVQALKL